MSDDTKPAIEADAVEAHYGSSYPAPYDKPCAEREKRALGDHFGLSDFGVNLVTLEPGVWSSQRHWHTHEDELIYVLSGEPTLVTDEGERQLRPGMCAGFPANNANGHVLINNTTERVTYLEIGSRNPDDDCHYADIDMQILKRGKGGWFSRKTGEPYAR